ncbi:TPA: hypothetical protein MYQ36_000208 [Citrobacter braakii]|uniref:hypothetical protein n=1 Tax=Citrobacter braakii TaxID=57706 RepID=UPI003D98D368|nr:hypothetical protein [Citrobacter braakii]
MKRTVLSAGLISAMLLFSTSAISSNNAPNSGKDVSANFGFLTRTPASLGPHYFTVRVSSVFGFNNGGRMSFSVDAYQTFGVNVYWKTKGYDQDKGRNIPTAVSPNLPRCSFSRERQCDSNREKLGDRGSSEHLEGLVWTYNGVMNSYNIKGKVPDKWNRVTRFFEHRFSGAQWNSGDSGSPLPPGPRPVDDPNVRLSSVFFTQSDDLCDDAGKFCGGQDGKQTPQSITISSNDLEYLVIEVIGFQHDIGGPVNAATHEFWTFPVMAVKYVPKGNGKKMKILRTDKNASSGMEVFVNSEHAAGFPSSTPSDNTGGYWDAGDSNIHGGGEEVDFEKIDILDVTLKYNSERIEWWKPESTGIAVDFSKTDLNCIPWAVTTCRYPGP